MIHLRGISHDACQPERGLWSLGRRRGCNFTWTEGTDVDTPARPLVKGDDCFSHAGGERSCENKIWDTWHEILSWLCSWIIKKGTHLFFNLTTSWLMEDDMKCKKKKKKRRTLITNMATKNRVRIALTVMYSKWQTACHSPDNYLWKWRVSLLEISCSTKPGLWGATRCHRVSWLVGITKMKTG